jgi:hypothetical protein
MRPATARGLVSGRARGGGGSPRITRLGRVRSARKAGTPPRGRQTLPWSDGVRRRVRKIEAHDLDSLTLSGTGGGTMPQKHDRLSVKIPLVLEGVAEGRFAITALLILAVIVMVMATKSLGWW